VTPRGLFEVYGQIDGLRVAPLGLLWRPKYVNGGIAVHGSPSVPPWPASHGCVRLGYPAMDMIWADGLMPMSTAVWVR
jgi:lipoprotein-anchoring transpeptidase ErfK/SrfK